MSALVLGLPSKGRLQADTIGWFQKRGIEISQTGSDRRYAASVDGLDGLEVVMLSAGEIPRELGAGRIHLGVTGEDMIRERLPGAQHNVEIIENLAFGHADLIVAVPAFWVDVETMHDLDEVAHAFRQKHGYPLRIATKYHNLVRAFFQRLGVADYRLIDSQGATEAAPQNLMAEAIADITSSGATLRANHLKILMDGLILKSQAVLARSTQADWTEAAETALAELRSRKA